MSKKKNDTEEQKTLDEVLSEIPENTVVAIGSASSYFYISKNDKEEIFKKINLLNLANKKSLDLACETLESMKKALPLLPAKITKLEDELEDLNEAIKRKQHHIDIAKKNLERYPYLIEKKYPKRIKKLEKAIKEFIPASKRKVLKVYQQDGADHALVIIIEGDEQGKYLLQKEYETKKVNVDELE